MDSLQPNMAITIPGSISGSAVIDDLVSRIVDRLEKSGDLRSVDSYAGYAARVSISMQLVDLNQTSVNAEVNVGNIDPQLPVRTITLQPDVAGVADDSGSLERPIDPDGITQDPPRRMYVSRIRGRQ